MSNLFSRDAAASYLCIGPGNALGAGRTALEAYNQCFDNVDLRWFHYRDLRHQYRLYATTEPLHIRPSMLNPDGLDLLAECLAYLGTADEFARMASVVNGRLRVVGWDGDARIVNGGFDHGAA